jgi:hypothetical protein
MYPIPFAPPERGTITVFGNGAASDPAPSRMKVRIGRGSIAQMGAKAKELDLNRISLMTLLRRGSMVLRMKAGPPGIPNGRGASRKTCVEDRLRRGKRA